MGRDLNWVRVSLFQLVHSGCLLIKWILASSLTVPDEFAQFDGDKNRDSNEEKAKVNNSLYQGTKQSNMANTNERSVFLSNNMASLSYGNIWKMWN